jgi:L-cystine transport system substrate-binding protein
MLWDMIKQYSITALRHPRYISVLLLLALLGYAAWASISSQVQAEQNWRELRARGILRIGIDPGIQPFSFYSADGGALRWNGFDADLARELAARLNLKFSSDPVGYDSMYDALQTGRIDIALSAVSPDPNRTAEFAYSQAYFDAGIRAVSLSAINTTNINTDLAHKRVAVGLGSEADRQVRFWERRVPHLQRLPLPNDAAALAALTHGKADVALVSVFAVGGVDGASAWQVNSLAPRSYVIALRREDQRLLAEINRALAQMQQDGTLDALRQKWVK